VRPVNLLPAAERPRATVAAPRNASIIVLAVLGALLVGVAGYVFTKNQVTDRTAGIATAKQEQAQAEKRAAGLKAFGDFRQIKQTRIDAVTQLASQRFDWERFMRELALVLPSKVWLTEVTAADVSAAGASGSAAPAAPAAAAGGAAATAAGGTAGAPLVKITGCAPSQKSVAEIIVRLRSLHGADEVDLVDSTGPAKGAGAASSSGGSSSGAEGGQSCGKRFTFNSTVTFKAAEAAPTAKAKRVPATLGGGS
jgi:Tfp pilus assembly protein PilN